MKLTVISVLIIIFFIIPLTTAISFEFEGPESISLYGNFSVTISASTSEIYDIKIFIQDNSTKIIISEIYNGGWKNPYYYLKSVFPSQKSFISRAINHTENAAICVRLRKTGSSSYSESCKSIEITSQSIAQSENEIPSDSEEESEESEDSEGSEKIIMGSKNADFTPLQENKKSSPEVPPNEVIRLNSKNSNEVHITSSEKVRLYASYSFTALVILLVIFLIFKKL